MTALEKERISQLQQQGYGYKRIATELGLAVNGVKSYCRRHPVTIDTKAECKPGICQQCGNAINQLPGRKIKRFCSDRCRNKWWNEHQSLVKKKAYYSLVCRFCGRPFQSYGNQKRIYCSRECFAEARRKGGEKNE